MGNVRGVGETWNNKAVKVQVDLMLQSFADLLLRHC